MSLAARGARPAAALIATLTTGVLLAGCGGSVADADAAGERPAPRPAPNAFCLASRANTEAIGPLNTLVGTGGADPAELRRRVDAVRRSGADLVATAPPDVRTDVEQTVAAVDVQLDALLANGGDGRAVGSDPAVAAQLRSPELRAASERLGSYLTRTCGSGAQ